MYKLHEKSPQSGTERFKKVFTRGLNRFVPFRSILRLTFQSRLLFGTERNVSSRSRVNTCKNFFVFWNSSHIVPFRSVPFSCERGLRPHVHCCKVKQSWVIRGLSDFRPSVHGHFHLFCLLKNLSKDERCRISKMVVLWRCLTLFWLGGHICPL